MRSRWFRVVLPAAVAAILGLVPGLVQVDAQGGGTKPPAQTPARTGQKPNIAAALETQVRLDRAGFSPGEIDGLDGRNTAEALSALKKAGRTLETEPAEVVVPYVLTKEDVAGPFTERIPADMMVKAKLEALNYSSALEALGEKFHSAPALLQKLNPGARFAAGETIFVPNVLPRGFGDTPETKAGTGAGRESPAAPAPSVRIVVSKRTSTLQVIDEKGGVIFHAPVTSGSEHDPLPLGKWTVTAIARRPTFNYNPDLFWDANPAHAKAKIPPGPNNPVGLVWIDISKEHYGLHGTPEPGKVGHAESHGCVRMTNWDALHVAGLVRKGTLVIFEP